MLCATATWCIDANTSPLPFLHYIGFPSANAYLAYWPPILPLGPIYLSIVSKFGLDRVQMIMIFHDIECGQSISQKTAEKLDWWRDEACIGIK